MMHGSENVKCVFNYAVCLMAVPVGKQVVYSTELQKLFCSCMPAMIMVCPVTMYNKSVVYSTEPQVCCGLGPGMIMVTVL